MGSSAGIVLVHQGYGNRCIKPASGVGKRQIALCLYCLAVKIAEAQGVDQGGRVFDFTVCTHDGCLSVGFDCIAGAGKADHPFGKHFSQYRAIFHDFRFQVTTKRPAQGLVTMAATANIRHGFPVTLKPSMRVSSSKVTIFLISRGMNSALLARFGLAEIDDPHVECLTMYRFGANGISNTNGYVATMTGSLPPLTWFRSFESAARQLSFTAAAQELGLTQSAISQQVRLLELKFGSVLFLRKSRGLALTDEGRRLLPMVSQAIGTLKAAAENFDRGTSTNALTIATSVSIAQWYIVPNLKRFHEANPGTTVRLMTKVWPDEFLGTGVDAEIRFDSLKSPRKNSSILGLNQVVLVAAPEIASKLPPGQPDADVILEYPLIQAVGTADTWQTWADSAKIKRRITPAYLVDSHGLAIDLARSGTGIALTSSTIAAPCLNDGSLVLVGHDGTTAHEGYHLTVNSDGNADLAFRFAEWLAEEVGSAELACLGVAGH